MKKMNIDKPTKSKPPFVSVSREASDFCVDARAARGPESAVYVPANFVLLDAPGVSQR